MPAATEGAFEGLTPNVARFLGDLVEQASEVFGEQLHSIVLFGSGAEGRLRPTSDVNVIVVLSAFEQQRADRIRGVVQAGGAAVRMRVMFLLAGEIEAAAEAFGVKFNDILHRHRVLCGADPFARLRIDRDAMKQRLRQVLLNLILRLRNEYVVGGSREEQIVRIVNDAVGPLRAAAATLLEIEGAPASSTREALIQVADDLADPDLKELVVRLSQLRQNPAAAVGDADLVFRTIELAQRMRDRAEASTAR